MKCLTARDGTRWFAPADGVEPFLLPTSVGGLAILAQEQDLDAEARFSYHAMRLIFQHARRLREHLARSFMRESDLYIRGVERRGLERRDILPERIGFDRDERGRRWTVTELLKQGRAHAVAAGVRAPGKAKCIAAGLLVAAHRNPLDPSSLTEPEGRGLVRLTLFDLGPVADKLGEAAKLAVTERLLAAIERHKDDDTETFARWFFEDRANLIHQIAKQRKGGGPMPREDVRQVFLELVFDSYTYVANCIFRLMQAFLEALPSPLNDAERARFEAIYFNQPYFGGLPLILLRDRFAFLEEAIIDVFDDPAGSQRVGVLLRLMQYYWEMVTVRRQVDRDYKKQSHHRNAKGQIGRTCELNNGFADEPKAPPDDPFQQIADRLCEDRGITCPCGASGSWRARLAPGGADDDPIRIDLECPGCHHVKTIEIARGELERVGREVIQSPGNTDR
jgi:hypothetical protein